MISREDLEYLQNLQRTVPTSIPVPFAFLKNGEGAGIEELRELSVYYLNRNDLFFVFHTASFEIALYTRKMRTLSNFC